MTRLVLTALIVLGAAAASTSAFADASCTLTVAAPVTFGNYSPFNSSAATATGSLTVACTGYTGTYTISLNAGTYGTVNGREMESGGTVLSYQLYEDSADSIVWGDGSSGTETLSQSCSGTCNTTFSVYGVIAAGQDVPPGAYASTVTATLTY